MRAFDGSADDLAMVEQFTLRLAAAPYCRERATSMLEVAAFGDRASRLKATLDATIETVGAVRGSTSSEAGVLRGVFAHALALTAYLSRDDGARGIRLRTLSALGRYSSADKRVTLLQYIARRLIGAEEPLAELGRLETRLCASSRVVWSEVKAELDSLRGTAASLADLAAQIERYMEGDSHADGSIECEHLRAFVASTRAFVDEMAAPAVASLARLHAVADEACRALGRWLAHDDGAVARPEESFRALHEFVVDLRAAHRHCRAASEREKAARLRALASAGGGGVVDDVASRFSSAPGPVDRAQSADRSAELLRLLLRRASMTGGSRRRLGEDESASDSASGFTDDD